jgi:UDP-N-acetylmuramyl pentapeptide phosphotransferase/UDP-N-acetylglucosamine-1-phosphate transferase
MGLLLDFLSTAVGSFFLCYPLNRLLVYSKIVDHPNQRSSHSCPTARGGGVAVLIAAALVAELSMSLHATAPTIWIVASGMMLGALSFIDDIHSVPRILRFGAHTGAALAALTALGIVQWTKVPPASIAMLSLAAFFWITGYINAFNFMDGINGLAALQLVTTGIGTALVGLSAGANEKHPAIILSVVLAGAGIGFLPHNFPRARMFLGDVGSVPLGFFLAVFSLWLARDFGWWLLIAFGLLHANFIFDTSLTLTRRIYRGERCFEPHREHFYQRLFRAGKSHQFITCTEAFLQLLVLSLVLIAIRMGLTARVVAICTVCAIWITFFFYAEIKFRRCSLIANTH